MIFTLFAILMGLWCILDFKKKGSINWIYVGLTLMLLAIEVHFYILGGEIARYYWSSGSAGSGLTFERCTSDDGFGNCLTYSYFTYLSVGDTAIGDYITYRKMESTALEYLTIPLGACVLLAFIYITKDLLVDMRVIARWR